MPTKTKTFLTLMVIIISLLTSIYEYINTNGQYLWIILTVMLLMIIGLRGFPEAKGKITNENK